MTDYGMMNYIEPLINHGPFTEEEKNYVYDWIMKNQNHNMIRWEHLQLEILKEYGKFRLRNDLKTIWNTKKRQRSRQSSVEFSLSPLNEVDESIYTL
ncbi:hypothetical protein C1645_880723 [Glomus cerebriforme]|uniref:HTH myb-type domain-containing protein n=1 Tax=Glomus cerebriforme TaxID=658196 RepID=A0A397SEB7_9GLOM|nr:hypothetical protein C1645_880723 [Glomus cerebriforme]